MKFEDFVGHKDAKLALILNAIDPRCGGVLFVGERGSGKSTLARLFREILPEDMPFMELPLNVTEGALLGGIDVEITIKAGEKIFQKGILGRADGGIIYVDDINFLSPEIAALMLEVQGRGENVVEREGFAFKEPSRFVLIASMNPEGEGLSAHFLDRFGMGVSFETVKDFKAKMDIVKKSVPEIFGEKNLNTSHHHLKEKIRTSREFLGCIVVSPEMEDYMAELCLKNHISGHRGDLFLFYASRAYAAFCGEKEIKREHVETVSPLVFAPRQREIKEGMENRRHPDEKTESKDEDEKEHDGGQKEKPLDQDQAESSAPESSVNSNDKTVESGSREEVFQPGRPFRIRRLAFLKDRIKRAASGRRTKTHAKDRGGRYVKSSMNGKDDIALDATIRAAAPFQKIRRNKEMILIQEEDLRFKKRERRTGHLVIFVVDGSGSMGARKRMIETKGAIQSLLTDCYQKKDKVSLIVFRKDAAETVLPPTSSITLAMERLKDIPVGGKTPLAAGLFEAYKLIRRTSLKSPETRFILVLITDGRANHGMTKEPVEKDIEGMTKVLSKLDSVDHIVVDTEDKSHFIKTDLAMQIASKLQADYYTIDDLKAEYLTGIVQTKKT